MPADSSHEAIVLQTHDVGDADRFCIMLTRERGKIAARARGVRKLQSRMGGSLLPFQQAMVTIHEGGAGFLITSAHLQKDHASSMRLDAFLRAQYVAEILLTTLEDDHPVPEIFDLTADFLGTLKKQQVSIVPFLVRFLSTIGLLPRNGDHKLFAHLSENERLLIMQCAAPRWHAYPLMKQTDARQLQALCEQILDGHTRRPRAVRLH